MYRAATAEEDDALSAATPCAPVLNATLVLRI
jgi:hypothetical protein